MILDISLPWSRLYSLELGSLPLAPDVVLVLMHYTATSLCQALFYVDFEDPATGSITSTHRPLMDPPAVRMKRLKTLGVILGGRGPDIGFFDRVRAPQLQNLRIVEMMNPNIEGWNLDILSPLMASCSRKLEMLELVDSPAFATVRTSAPQRRQVTHPELETLLDSVPNLKTLRLPRTIFAHSVTLGKLADGRLLPSVKVLEMTASSPTNAEDFLFMLTMRVQVAEAARRGIGTSSGSRGGGIDRWLEEEAGYVELITDIVLHMTLAQKSVFVKDVVPKYFPHLGAVRIHVKAFHL
ncbi:hypothetical protein NLJ89_g3253 [Agrocybe chaxingu]|uniref:Uncharacterized protein n=1 Tax=Agrocybe chaxingu TaxID=84603 RepID=A0A9W8K4D0_9AGAR|nr:hypothetical protein NLJ89_g3253 [Agrocybe chaxingu]